MNCSCMWKVFTITYPYFFTKFSTFSFLVAVNRFPCFYYCFLLLLRLSFLLLLFCKWILCHVQTGTGGSATDGNLRNVSWCRHPQPNCIMESEEPSKAGRWWLTGEWRQKCFFFCMRTDCRVSKKITQKLYESIFEKCNCCLYNPAPTLSLFPKKSEEAAENRSSRKKNKIKT